MVDFVGHADMAHTNTPAATGARAYTEMTGEK